MDHHEPAPASVDESKKEHSHGHGHSHEHSENAAKIVGLGTVTLGGSTYMIDRDGQVECGKTTEFGVELVAGTATPSFGLLRNPDGTEVADPVKGEGHDSHWHFNVTPLDPVKKCAFVLKQGEEEAVVAFQRGAQPIGGGIMSVFKAIGGFLELKLHGDAGDLELWLYSGASLTQNAFKNAEFKPTPFDVPKETVVTITFPSHAGKQVKLAVRDMDKNPDEEGKENMRGGGTNYFIFPGETDQDPEWLKDEKWRGTAVVSFDGPAGKVECEPFVLCAHEALG